MSSIPLPRSTTNVLVVLLLASLVGMVAFEAGAADARASAAVRRQTAVVSAVKHAAPAVVSVFADSFSRRGSRRRGAGSGVIVHPDGYVVTNHHVIDDGQRLSVQLYGGRGTLPASIVLSEPSNDLAVLKIQSNGRLPYVSLCPGGSILGETAIAVGNPHGLGDTITVGVISAHGRDASMSNGVALRNLIQTDASINTGNSGGALLNLDGELLGIIVSLLPRASGIAFAIPGDQVKRVLSRALRNPPPANPLPDSLVRPVHPPSAHPPASSSIRQGRGDGLPAPSVTPGPGQAPQVKKAQTRPLRATDFGFAVVDTGSRIQVSRVRNGTAASRSGMLRGDILLAIDGTPVEAEYDLIFAFSRSMKGQEYFVEIKRDGVPRNLILTVP